VQGLRALGKDAYLFIDENNQPRINEILETAQFPCGKAASSFLISHSSFLKWQCIVLDYFQTSPEVLARWSAIAPVIGIDEGGPCRDRFDFLIDILPNLCHTKPNITALSLLPLKKSQTKKSSFLISHSSLFKVLVSFGQEDTAGLGLAVTNALAAKNSNNMEITWLQGKLGTSPTPQCGVAAPPVPRAFGNCVPQSSLPNLAEHLIEYDLVITHYGLTAFEALYAGVPVLLVSPTAYHEKLAHKAGFYSLGVGKAKANKIAINHPFIHQLQKRCAALAARHTLDHPPRQSLAELVSGFAPIVSRKCIACGTARGADSHNPAIARFPERSYRRCKRCGVISMSRLNPPPITYSKEYFFELYQQQYGKTYLEDFPHLIAMAKRRLKVIKGTGDWGLGTGERPFLLDIGCAYGAFLAAAREEGFAPYGIDPAADAIHYVTETLSIPATQGFFPEIGTGDWGMGTRESSLKEKQVTNIFRQQTTNPSPQSPVPSPYTVITLWYVIEHFQDCVPVLAEIRKLLKPGGMAAFATPSFAGISGRRSLKRFLEHSPADHWTVWSPASSSKALQMAGFTVRKIVNSGHHPERFPFLGTFARSKKSPLYWLLLAVSRIFSLGDTFEVYAVKNEQ